MLNLISRCSQGSFWHSHPWWGSPRECLEGSSSAQDRRLHHFESPSERIWWSRPGSPNRCKVHKCIWRRVEKSWKNMRDWFNVDGRKQHVKSMEQNIDSTDKLTSLNCNQTYRPAFPPTDPPSLSLHASSSAPRFHEGIRDWYCHSNVRVTVFIRYRTSASGVSIKHSRKLFNCVWRTARNETQPRSCRSWWTLTSILGKDLKSIISEVP